MTRATGEHPDAAEKAGDAHSELLAGLGVGVLYGDLDGLEGLSRRPLIERLKAVLQVVECS